MASSGDHRKRALLIGNSAYTQTENRLDHSSENVEKLNDLLEKIGFEVTRAFDLKKYEMSMQMIDFSKTIETGDLVLFYFCGHACQANGTNYLIPINDAWMKTERDVQDFFVHLDRMIKRIVERNVAYANLFILDCCRPYRGKDSDGTIESKGLCEMKSVDGAFIQFACAANQTVRENIFAKQFFEHVIEENVNIGDLFQRVVDDVCRESNEKQRPLSINGLRQQQKIYLNYVPPPISLTDEVKEQAQLKDYYDQFPDLDQVTNLENGDIRKAEIFTQDLLSKLPSGDVNDKETAFHVVNQLFKDEDEQCLFFDSSQGVHLYNTFGNLTDRSVQSKPFVLQLHRIEGFDSEENVTDELTAVNTLNRVIRENECHRVTDDIIERLAKAHNVEKKNIVLKCVYRGSVNIVYMILQPTLEPILQQDKLELRDKTSIDDLVDLKRRLEGLFKQFKGVKIHPLARRPTFDVGVFDEHGYRDFRNESRTFDIGPEKRRQQYIQPTGWIRHGWSVVGTYSTDAWLRPFQNPQNWYRAYHGTKNARAEHIRSSDSVGTAVNLPLQAAFNIAEQGFDKAINDVHGEGVYCSPKATYVENHYVGTAVIDTQRGKRSYKIMLQVAVNPDGVRFVNDNIWLIRQPENIRTYGLLIKDDHSE